MFGRKRKKATEDGGGAPAAPPDGRAGGEQSNEDAHAFNQRCGVNLDEVATLEASGRKALAELLEVRLVARMESLGQREFAVTAEVRPPDGPPFRTSFPIFDTTHGLYTPNVGQVIAVVHDDADPPMVRAGLFWDKPGLEMFEVEDGPVLAVRRWTVPHECPTCGAPVDQARESQVARPACAMCRTPLPVEPAAG